MRQYVIQNEVIWQETNVASLPSSLNAGDGLKMENVTDRWWGWNFVCLFLLYSTTVNNLVPNWLIPMYQNRIFFFTDDYFQPFLFHLFFFIPDFPSLNDCLCLIFSPPAFHILTYRHLNWLISVSLLFDLTTWLNFSLCSVDFFIESFLPLCGV